MPSNNSVEIEKFALSHFVKSFEKKYKQHWNRTFRSIIDGLERMEFLLHTDKAETICDAGNIKIIKTQPLSPEFIRIINEHNYKK